MTAKTLALVLIRVFAIKFLVETLTTIASQIPMFNMMRTGSDDDAFGYNGYLFWMIGILIVSKLVLSCLLFIYSRKIADRIVGDNTEKLEAHPQLAPILTHVGILLIGVSTLVYSLPGFLGTAIQWFQAHASQPEVMATQQNAAMARVTTLLILSLFLLLRGKTLTRWLIRLSK